MESGANKVGKVTRADGRELRRLIAYLPPGVMSKMRYHCAEHGISSSKLATVALSNYLDAAEHVAKVMAEVTDDNEE